MRKTGRANIWLGYCGKLKLSKRCLWGDGNPPTRDNSSPCIQALVFTTFTIALMNITCYIAVEVYVWDVAESLSCW